jgi:hypothetical protein
MEYSIVARGSLAVAGAVLSGWLLGGCGGKTAPAPPPGTPSDPSEAPPDSAAAETTAASPRTETEKLRQSLRAAESEISRLRVAVTERSSELTALEEANATLELELRSALEELVRSQASVRNVQSRAFAVSRIAEVRVELQSWRKRPDPALADRLDRASNFLDRADRALAEENVGGAAYLAERASELVRQVRTIAEIRGGSESELIPIVPPRTLEVLAPANLRKDASAESQRMGSVEVGTRLVAIARRGDWFQVQVEGKEPLWIHRRLVR